MSTVNEAFKKFYPLYQANRKLPLQQLKAASNIMRCRTKEMGSHIIVCNSCSHVEISYNSCKNRHCPLCQGVTKAVWVDRRYEDVLDAPYFHIVFTVPKQLHTLIYQNQKLLYGLLYKAVSETLLELCFDKRYLGAQPGFFCVLHTWAQDLSYHPHLHVVIMAGGLTGLHKWRKSSDKFFIPVKVLSKKFRGKYLYYLKKYYQQQELSFYGVNLQFKKPKEFYGLLTSCYNLDWYSYSKAPFAGPMAVIKYLSRYTHRIAISNSRIVLVDDEAVTFTVRDRKDKRNTKNLTLKGTEFVRRFLLHTLPKGFVKIRYYGVLANRNKKTKLALCQKLSASKVYKPLFKGLTTTQILSLLLQKDVTKCPKCEVGRLKVLGKGPSP